jgi:hypothetical protein
MGEQDKGKERQSFERQAHNLCVKMRFYPPRKREKPQNNRKEGNNLIT